jgi:hypothetical protein
LQAPTDKHVAELREQLANMASEVRAAEGCARRAEANAEETELLLREEMQAREVAEEKLNTVVSEIQEQEGQLLDEIVLLKMTLEGKEGTFRSSERALNLEVQLLREENEALSNEIAELNAGKGGRPDSLVDSLSAELAEANGDGAGAGAKTVAGGAADAWVAGSELRKAKRDNVQMQKKLDQMQLDMSEKSEMLDKVIAKWTSAVKHFLTEAEDPAGRVALNTATPYLRGPEVHADGSPTRDGRPRIWRGVVDTGLFDLLAAELVNKTLQVSPDGNSPALQKFCALLERIFYHGFITTPGFFSFSKRRDPWDFIATALRTEEIVKKVLSSRCVCTSIGRFRLFIRWALTEHRLAEYVQAAFAVRPIVSKFYDPSALLWKLETIVHIDKALYSVTADASITINPETYPNVAKGEVSLDEDWPAAKKYVAM